jgi:7-cyano-7-deazaguanine synthase
MDSITLLHYLTKVREEKLVALSFNYGQRHSKELECAKQNCLDLDIEHKIIDLTWFGSELANNSALTGEEAVPYGHYASENMKKTVVPFRNGVMLSLAVAYAENIEANRVYCGVHTGDHFIYPDCTEEFVKMFSLAATSGTFNKVKVIAPFNDLKMDKGHIALIGTDIGVDYSKTWTCYEGKNKPCGKCGACVERREAFEQNELVDTLI